ncbi:MAG: hypothetical protein EBT80_00625 [Chitinophagales bacterium]|nr:hypothetical protein [Chitinophagales bacterium]
MSTRSILARYTLNDPNNPSAWEGRYCHWDGYPSHMGEQLRWIVSRDGHKLAGDTIMKHEWSAMDAQRTSLEWKELYPSEDWNIVAGYGTAYNTNDGYIYTHDDAEALSNSWCEFLYIITPENTIDVFTIEDGKIVPYGESIRADLPIEMVKQ